ncbi:MAG TPA: hypothetical protein V6D16_23350, partial [Candidatus Obscuribacterales bacterium]
MSAETDEQKTAKQALREALMAYEGDPKHQAVAAAIKHLNRLNPIVTLADYEALMDGEWVL